LLDAKETVYIISRTFTFYTAIQYQAESTPSFPGRAKISFANLLAIATLLSDMIARIDRKIEGQFGVDKQVLD
jgi:hypothetical protein